MKALFHRFIILFFLQVTLMAHEESLHLSLEGALKRVEVKNLTVILNHSKVDEVCQDSNIKRADIFPQIDVHAMQSRSRVLSNFGGPIFPFHVNRFDAAFEGTFSAFDLRKWANYKSARIGYNVSEFDYQKGLQNAFFETTRAYFTHLRNLKRLDVIDANIRRDQTLLDLTRIQFQAGTASPIDVTRSEVQLATERKERLQQETNVKESELNLKKILDISVHTSLTIDKINAYEGIPGYDYSFSIEHALTARPDYLRAQRQLDRNKYDRRAANWDYYPKLDLFGDWGIAAGEISGNKQTQEWTIGLVINMPIFDGFRIQSNKLKNNARIRQQESFIKDLENTISSEIVLNQKDLQSRYNQIDIVKLQVKLSERELELAKIRFEQGVADNRDVVDAQANLAKFSDDFVEAVYQYNLARLDWARIMGDVLLVVGQ